jgi:UDP-glucose 4-epimerase
VTVNLNLARGPSSRVLVTGGAGFIGSRLVGRLLAADAHVTVVDDLSLGRRANLADHLGDARLDVQIMDCTTPAFADLVVAVKPDRVFHLAANSDIGLGTRDPKTDLNKTFATTFGVLDAMRRAGTREIVFASTSAIYGEVPGLVPEDHGPLQPISLYGAAKLASEAYISAFLHLYDMVGWIFRFPNVTGPNLTHGAIHDFVERLHRDRTELTVLGNGTQTKPFLDVDDLLDAIAVGLAAPATPLAVYNVAGEGATTVRAIAEMVRDALRLPQAIIKYGNEDRGWRGDVPRFSYDTTKIRALGWTPRRTSDEAVLASIEAEVRRCKPSS